MMRVAAIIVCAGKGRRFGSTHKAVVPLAGKPLFYHCFKAFCGIADIRQIIIVLQKVHIDVAKRFLPRYLRRRYHVFFVCGGKERIDSVRNGLSCLDKSIDYVLIHDGARPFVSKSVIISIIKNLRRHPAVICGLAARDTIKQVNARSYVRRTLDRRSLVLVQTPQGFKKDILLTAYKKNKKGPAFDDSQLVETMGVKVKVVEGDIRNFKITYPQDLQLAKALIKS